MCLQFGIFFFLIRVYNFYFSFFDFLCLWFFHRLDSLFSFHLRGRFWENGCSLWASSWSLVTTLLGEYWFMNTFQTARLWWSFYFRIKCLVKSGNIVLAQYRLTIFVVNVRANFPLVELSWISCWSFFQASRINNFWPSTVRVLAFGVNKTSISHWGIVIVS